MGLGGVLERTGGANGGVGGLDDSTRQILGDV